MNLKGKVSEIGKLTEDRKKCLLSELNQIEKELCYLKAVMEAISPFTELKESHETQCGVVTSTRPYTV